MDLQKEIEKLIEIYGSDEVLKTMLEMLPGLDKKYQEYHGTVGIALLNLISKEKRYART